MHILLFYALINDRVTNRRESMRVEDVKSGVRVRCTNDRFKSYGPDFYKIKIENLSLPRKGQIYTIRKVCKKDDLTGIRLSEIKNSQFKNDTGKKEEPCFSLSRFELVKKE